MSGRAPSSQHYHHHNNPSSASRSQQRPPAVATTTTGGAAASPANITCSLCGCLNFSNQPTCEPCRQKTATTTASSTTGSGSDAAGGGNSGSGRSSSPVVAGTLPVSPRTAILKKQTPAPPPRTGIVTGLRHGLPIDAYRNGGRRNSLLGAKINRDSESPASSQSQSQSQSATLTRSNSSSESDHSAGGEDSHSRQAEKPSQGKELYQRVLVQQRQSLEAKRKAEANTSYKTASEAGDEVDEKNGIAQYVDAGTSSNRSNSASGAASSVAETPTAAPRPNKRPRVAGSSREVIDLISSSDEDEGDDDAKSVDGGKQSADATASTTRASTDKSAEGEPRVQAPATGATATTKPRVRTEPGAPAVPVVSAAAAQQPPVAVAAAGARIPASATIATPSPAVLVHPQDTADDKEVSDEELPFRSRRFSVVEFDPIDFPPTDAAAALKLRARRSSSGLEASVAATAGLSQQQTAVAAQSVRTAVAVPPATSSPLPKPEDRREREKVASKPTPTPAPTAPVVAQKVREEPGEVQTSLSAVSSNADVEMIEETQQETGSSAKSASASSIRSLKRAASGNCQEQAIELGDDDESSQEQVFSSTRGELFLSRIFQSIEFSASDFSTVHDGLHVARRSKISAQNAAPEPPQQQRATGDVGSTQERPTNATTARNGAVVPPPSAPRPVPATPSRPATIPPDSDRAPSTTSSRSTTSVVGTREVPRVQQGVPARQVNVVPMSPRNPSVARVEAKTPASRVEATASVPSVERNAPAPSFAARPALPPQVPAPVPKPTATPPVATLKPTTTTMSVIVSKPTVSAPLNASPALLSSSSRSSETARATTTTSAVPERSTTTTTTTSSSTITILLARKKTPQATPVSVSSGAPESVTKDVKTNTVNLSSQQVAKKEEVVKAREVVAIAKQISKPLALGDCSADFMGFMKDFIDGDDDEPMDDEEETRKLHLQLLEVVDLTNLTDSDDDDSSDDGYDISEPPTATGAAGVAAGAKPMLVLTGVDRPGFGSQSMHHPTPAFGAVSGLGATSFFISDPSRRAPQMTFTAAAGGIVGPPKPDRRRAVRQLEPCVICEEKRWVKTLIHCEDCGKYYHKKCAKDYGDEKICWNCELDGMIDDSDLTETARDAVVGMLSTLRHASSSSSEGEEDDDDDEVAESGASDGADPSRNNGGEAEESKKETDNDDDDDDEEEEDESKRDNVAATATRKPPLLPGSSTKSMQRWKTFLDVSTATVDKSFHEVTKSIDAELQSEEQKAKYSKGFTTPEIFQAQISEVLDSYADLQDQLDREAREKLRGPSAVSGAGGAEAHEAAAVAAAESGVVSPSVRESASVSTRVILDLSGSSDAPVQSVQATQQVNREVAVSDDV